MTLFDDTSVGNATKAFYQIVPVVPIAIPHTSWNLSTLVPLVDSQEDTDGGGCCPPTPGTNALDGDPNTFWHTQWNTENPPAPPHQIQFDLGATFSIAGFRHLPRQDDIANGRIADYQFYVSTNGSSWTLASAGTLPDTMGATTILFPPQTARYVRLVAVNSYPTGNFATSLAELDILTEKVPRPSITSPASDLTITVGQSVSFTATTTNLTPGATANYLWTFSPELNLPNSVQQNPGTVQFNTSGTFTVTLSVTDSLGLTGPSATRVITVLPSAANNLSRAGWTLYFVDSQELTDANQNGCCAPTPATNAFDGDINTFWHTEWVNLQPLHPHDIVLNLGATHSVIGFRHLPRQDGMPNGRIGHYEFYVTNVTDGFGAPVWGSPVATGLLPDTASETEVRFAPVSGKFIWLRAVDALPANIATSLAELNAVTNE